MNKSSAVDGRSSIFFIFEVPHEIVSASAANLAISFSIRLIYGNLEARKNNTGFLEGLSRREVFKFGGVTECLRTSKLTHSKNIMEINVQVEEEQPR